MFLEAHPDPETALSDGPNPWPLRQVEALLEILIGLDRTVKGGAFV